MSVDIEKLEALAKTATPGPWETETYVIYARNERGNLFPVAETILPIDFDHTYTAHKKDAAYITAACNAVPELIAENRDLQKRVQELEKQRNWLAKKHAIACIDAACDACTSHIGDCPICPLPQGEGLCIEVSAVTFINAAKEATKDE